MNEPRTAAGRRLLDLVQMSSYAEIGVGVRNAILAIEDEAYAQGALHENLTADADAEAVASPVELDVERLAKALHADAESIESEPADWKDCQDRAGHLEYAEFLAREYAALRASEQADSEAET